MLQNAHLLSFTLNWVNVRHYIQDQFIVGLHNTNIIKLNILEFW